MKRGGGGVGGVGGDIREGGNDGDGHGLLWT